MSGEKRVSDSNSRPTATGARRAVYFALGWIFVVLAALGVLLPLLPTTPFLLLASACFVRSSPRLHRWLLRSRLFGPILRDWQEQKGVRLHVKLAAITIVVGVVAATLVWSNWQWPLQALLVGLAAVGLTVIVFLPAAKNSRPIPGPDDVAKDSN